LTNDVAKGWISVQIFDGRLNAGTLYIPVKWRRKEKKVEKPSAKKKETRKHFNPEKR